MERGRRGALMSRSIRILLGFCTGRRRFQILLYNRDSVIRSFSIVSQLRLYKNCDSLSCDPVVCIDGAKDIPAPPKHDPPPAPVPQIITAEPPPIIFTAEPPPMVPVSQPKAVEGGFGTGSNVMDDIIEHSQQRMLEAIQRLARRVNVLAVSARAPGNSHALEDPTSSSPELSFVHSFRPGCLLLIHEVALPLQVSPIELTGLRRDSEL